jgi:hypothetical protein
MIITEPSVSRDRNRRPIRIDLLMEPTQQEALVRRFLLLSTGRGISSLWGVQFSPLGGDGDQPFERSGPPVFGGRPRRLIGAVDD